MPEDDSDLLVPNQLVGNDQPIQGVIQRGQLALARLEQNQAWPDWCAVINALAISREICRQASGGHDKGRSFNEAMERWLRCCGFDRIDKSDRSRLLRCAGHLEAIDAWRSGLPLGEQLELNHLKGLNTPSIGGAILFTPNQSFGCASATDRVRPISKQATHGHP
jgi:hypothetical protein